MTAASAAKRACGESAPTRSLTTSRRRSRRGGRDCYVPISERLPAGPRDAYSSSLKEAGVVKGVWDVSPKVIAVLPGEAGRVKRRVAQEVASAECLALDAARRVWHPVRVRGRVGGDRAPFIGPQPQVRPFPPKRQAGGAHRVAINHDESQPDQAPPPPNRHPGGLNRPPRRSQAQLDAERADPASLATAGTERRRLCATATAERRRVIHVRETPAQEEELLTHPARSRSLREQCGKATVSAADDCSSSRVPLASMLHSCRTSASAGGAGGWTPPCTTRRWSMSTSRVCSGG